MNATSTTSPIDPLTHTSAHPQSHSPWVPGSEVKVTSAVQHTELMQVLDDRLIATTDVPGSGPMAKRENWRRSPQVGVLGKKAISGEGHQRHQCSVKGSVKVIIQGECLSGRQVNMCDFCKSVHCQTLCFRSRGSLIHQNPHRTQPEHMQSQKDPSVLHRSV